MRGRITTHDHALLVRKHGDPALAAPSAAGAPCCRHTPGAVAQQLGRPLSDSDYRSAAAARQAEALGWSQDYWAHEDLEAERLFDYGQLAPAVRATPLAATTCQDTRLAGAGALWNAECGAVALHMLLQAALESCPASSLPPAAGSPVLWGTQEAFAPHSLGRNKRLALVPAGFDWVTRTEQVWGLQWGMPAGLVGDCCLVMYVLPAACPPPHPAWLPPAPACCPADLLSEALERLAGGVAARAARRRRHRGRLLRGLHAGGHAAPAARDGRR